MQARNQANTCGVDALGLKGDSQSANLAGCSRSKPPRHYLSLDAAEKGFGIRVVRNVV